MKTFTIFVILVCAPAAFAIFSAGINDDLHKFEEDCVNESGVSFADIEIIRKTRVVPDNKNFNQFAKCMMQKYKVLNADGKVNQDVNTYEVPSDTPNTLLDAANTCKTQSGTDDADTARKIMNCFMKNGQIILAFTPRKSNQ